MIDCPSKTHVPLPPQQRARQLPTFALNAVSFSRAWTGHDLQARRINVEADDKFQGQAQGGLSYIDPMQIRPTWCASIETLLDAQRYRYATAIGKDSASHMPGATPSPSSTCTWATSVTASRCASGSLYAAGCIRVPSSCTVDQASRPRSRSLSTPCDYTSD